MILKPFASDCEDTRKPGGPSQCKAGEATLVANEGAATVDSTRSTPSGSAEENGREWSQKGDFNGQMSFATASNGILPLIKPVGKMSFGMVSLLRKVTGIQKIGHAGTLDPFATGVMVMLIGKAYTRLSDQFLNEDKEYRAKLHLGISTDSYDSDGTTTHTSPLIPTLSDIESTLPHFQGTISQVPPMFSAKKINGKKLYELARKGVTIERAPAQVTLSIQLLSYAYPYLEIDVRCSKGTYIRSLAHDIGQMLGCGAHLCALLRTRSGAYRLEDCCETHHLTDPHYNWQQHLRTHANLHNA